MTIFVHMLNMPTTHHLIVLQIRPVFLHVLRVLLLGRLQSVLRHLVGVSALRDPLRLRLRLAPVTVLLGLVKSRAALATVVVADLRQVGDKENRCYL